MAQKIVKLYGYMLSNYLNEHFLPGTSHWTKFVRFSNPKSVLKLDSLNDKKLYSFSLNYHKLVTPKFELLDDYDYYVYQDDLNAFNNMSEQEQLNYLNNIIYEDICIGCIPKNKICKLLKSKIKLNTDYHILVSEGEETNTIWWLIKELNICIWSKSEINDVKFLCMEFVMSIDTTKSVYNDILDTLDELNQSNNIKVKIEKNLKKRYHTAIKLFGYMAMPSEEKSWKLFSEIIVISNYPNKGQLYKVYLNNNVFSSYQSNFVAPNYFINSKESIQQILYKMGNDLLDSPYFDIGETLTDYFSK